MFDAARCPWIELGGVGAEESSPGVVLCLFFWELTKSLLQLRFNLGKSYLRQLNSELVRELQLRGGIIATVATVCLPFGKTLQFLGKYLSRSSGSYSPAGVGH